MLAIICIILTACGGQKSTPTVFPSITPEPSITTTHAATVTPVATSTPTKILPTQPPPTPTFTPFPPYQNKQVVFDYYIVGNHADYAPFFEYYCCAITKLILYDDGQMIIGSETETYKQKVLSSNAIKQFLSKLETLGFYSLESNQQYDQTDKLYNFGNNYQEVNDGLKYCILMKAERFCVQEDYMQYLISEMKNILKYLDEYKPAGTNPYYPDRILLTIQTDIDPSLDNPPPIPWDEHFPSLETSNPSLGYSTTSIYVDGDMAKKIYLFLEHIHTRTKVVSQNGKEYIIYIRVILPHEKVKNPYQ